jgi:quercetin dioxygenase-like cupin family protein|tara:strand:+ start:249 stop:524 length:276 start_codon:yes stop_codon:yes gene_type:complete
MDFPFKEEKIDQYNFIRTFPADVDEMDLIWHADKENRIITVLEGNGWKFQFDEELPIEMTDGLNISIFEGRIHRIIKGEGLLKIKLQKNAL